MRLTFTSLANLGVLLSLSAQVNSSGGGSSEECSISADQEFVCAGDSITLTATTTLPSIQSSGSLPFIPGNGLTDIDGNTYTSAIIGTQEWMTENLRTTAFSNGDPIPFVPVDFAGNTPYPCEYNGQLYDNCWYAPDTSDWGLLATGAYCYPNNDPSTDPMIGKLYHGLTFMDPRGLCPEGWHVPSNTEFEQLLAHLSIDPEEPSADLNTLLLNGSNASGFSAVLSAVVADVQISGPNEWRLNAAIFGSSSSLLDPMIIYPTYVYPQNMTYGLYLNYISPVMLTPYWSWHTMSCRCVKDATGIGELQYQWNNGATSATINETPIATSTYTVSITNGTDDCMESILVVVANAPQPTIALNDNLLSTPSIGTAYQWYLNGSAVPGAISAELELQGSGAYTVEVISADGCRGVSQPYSYLSTGLEQITKDGLRIQPNPNNGIFWMEYSPSGEVNLSVFDITGRQILTTLLQDGGNNAPQLFNLSTLHAGTYLLQVSNAGEVFTKRILIE